MGRLAPLLVIAAALPCWAQPYTLTITATNGNVFKDPSAADYAEGTVVQLIAEPLSGYYFTGWTGDVAAAEARNAMLRITMTANKALTANFALWKRPIGIPEPSWGIWETYRGYDADGATAANGQHIHYTRNSTLSYQPSDLGGFYTHYVDNTAPGATDVGRPYGTKDAPRATIPLFGTSTPVPPGSIIEVHGGPYASADRKFNGIGTVDQPIFLRGPSITERPQFTVEQTLGYNGYTDAQYWVVENLHWRRMVITTRAGSHHLAIRNCEFSGTLLTGGLDGMTISAGSAALSTSSLHDVLVYGCRFHTYGDWQAADDPDGMGIAVASGYGLTRTKTKTTTNIWILDNTFYRCSGNGVQVNEGGYEDTQGWLNHVYLGRNHCWENKQDGLWNKTGADIIYSQNNCWDHTSSDSSMGGGLGHQYGASRLWFLFNRVHHCYFGIRCSTDMQYVYGAALDNYYIGNVIYDIYRPEGRPGGWYAYKQGAAFFFGQGETDATMTTRYCYLNTLYDCMTAFQMGKRGIVVAHNNICAGLAEELYYNEYAAPHTNTEVFNNIVYPTAQIRWGRTAIDDLTSIQAYDPDHFTGTAVADPLFVDPENADFHLSVGSPAIDSAVLATRTQAALDRFYELYGLDLLVDADGNLRDATPDKGAYEYDADLPPGAPSSPTPADDATGVANSLTLRWDPGVYAAYYIVKRDTVNPPVAVLSSRCTTNSVPSGPLAPGTEYFWQVTSVNGSGQTAGPVWSFTTETPISLPGTISNPSPADGATSAPIPVTLSWTAALDAATYDVWRNTADNFGTATLISDDQVGLTCAAGTLAYSTQYWWWVRATNAGGNGTAVKSTFTTMDEPPAPKMFLFQAAP